MSIIGKLHEVSMYGLISTIVLFASGKVTLPALCDAAFCPTDAASIFMCYLFWASILFIPIAVVGAFSTKYGDYGDGLTFHSNNIVVIMFSHIGEELLGLLLSPFWFLRDLFKHNLKSYKVIDYILYAIEIVLILAGFHFIWTT